MPFAQINFPQKVGKTNLGIKEIGCFITGDANLLEKIGVHVDPYALNTFYTQHNLYTYDLTDKANDDITWSTVTKYHPQLVVKQIGGAGFPTSDLAQVEFRYQSVQNPWIDKVKSIPNMITHFCTVNHAADHSIIDSYDGKVKTPAEYEHVYGKPVAWATFVNNVPAPVHPVVTPKPVVNPVYITVQPGWGLEAVAQKAGFKDYTLPARWAAIAKLNGSNNWQDYNAHLQPGQRVMVSNGGHGEGEDTTATSLPVSEVIPAPVVAPVIPPAPVEPEAPAAPVITYEPFTDTMSLVTREGAKSYNFEINMAIQNFQTGTEFKAVGKATLANNDAYYMESDNFRADDETQRKPVGVKTIDLMFPPKEEVASTPEVPAADTLPVAEDNTRTPATIPVTTLPAAPITPTVSPANLPWQRTMKLFMNPVPYIVKEDMKVYNFETGNDEIAVKEGSIVKVGGKFLYNGSYYYRSQSSIDKGTWYGFLVTSLVKQDATNTPFNTNDDINTLEYEAMAINKSKMSKINRAATAHHLLSRLKIK